MLTAVFTIDQTVNTAAQTFLKCWFLLSDFEVNTNQSDVCSLNIFY